MLANMRVYQYAADSSYTSACLPERNAPPDWFLNCNFLDSIVRVCSGGSEQMRCSTEMLVRVCSGGSEQMRCGTEMHASLCASLDINDKLRRLTSGYWWCRSAGGAAEDRHISRIYSAWTSMELGDWPVQHRVAPIDFLFSVQFRNLNKQNLCCNRCSNTR